MSNGLNAASVRRVLGPAASAAAPTNGAGAADGGAAAEYAASKADVERGLPALCARRDRQPRDGTHLGDTAGGHTCGAKKVGALNRAVRSVDERIVRAYSDYGLLGRLPSRSAR